MVSLASTLLTGSDFAAAATITPERLSKFTLVSLPDSYWSSQRCKLAGLLLNKSNHPHGETLSLKLQALERDCNSSTDVDFETTSFCYEQHQSH